ncbi:MAG: hypothetical protein L6Q77_14330 [Bacteroidetes bacterium]|nr:hypothetical protein [Bacteroidota bacterium]
MPSPVRLFFWSLWEFPHVLAGAVLYLVYRKSDRKVWQNNRLFIRATGFSVSLGWFIFWTDETPLDGSASPTVLHHEFGHSVQSRRLGPGYLVVVGIPSALRNFYGRMYWRKYRRSWGSYYAGFPENQADRLGKTFPGI